MANTLVFASNLAGALHTACLCGDLILPEVDIADANAKRVTKIARIFILSLDARSLLK